MLALISQRPIENTCPRLSTPQADRDHFTPLSTRLCNPPLSWISWMRRPLLARKFIFSIGLELTVTPDTSIVFLDVPPSFQALALGNEDILQEIFNHMGIDVNSPSATFPKARKDLLNAAQTSKAFLEPALNALWRVLPSLFPLLKLLQSSLVLRQGKYVSLSIPRNIVVADLS